VIEAIGESKSYRAGDHVGETGVVIKDIRDYVIVEFQGKRFKMSSRPFKIPQTPVERSDRTVALRRPLACTLNLFPGTPRYVVADVLDHNPGLAHMVPAL